MRSKFSVCVELGWTVNVLVTSVPDPERSRFTVRVIGKRVEVLLMLNGILTDWLRVTSPGTSAVGARNVESLAVLGWSCPSDIPFASRARANAVSVFAPRIFSDGIVTEKSPVEEVVTVVLNASILLGRSGELRR